MDNDEHDATTRDYRATIIDGEIVILRPRRREEKRTIPETIDGEMAVRCIAKEAFSGGILEVLTIPDTLTQIGASAFYNCKRLEKVNMGDSVRVIEESAFNNCKKLTKIVLPESLVEIGEKAFRNTALHEIIIPDSVVVYLRALP